MEDSLSEQEKQKSPLPKILLTAVTMLLILAYAGFVVWQLSLGSLVPANLASSPTESRDVPEYVKGSIGILKPDDRELDDDRPAGVPMALPVDIPGANDDFLLDWGEEAAGAEAVLRPDPWVDQLVGDDSIELVAFASWVPQAGDDFNNPDFSISPNFYDAETLAPLSTEALMAMGVPEAFLSMPPPKRYPTGKLRLLFKTSGMEYVAFKRIEGADTRTESVVTYQLGSWGTEEPSFSSEGEWTRLDTALLVWHDTPIRFLAQVLTGEPIVAELDQAMGAQVVFADKLRLQYLKQYGNDLHKKSTNSFAPDSSASDGELASYYADEKDLAARKEIENTHANMTRQEYQLDPEDVGEYTLLRSSSYYYSRNHCGHYDTEGNLSWQWSRESSEEAIELARLNHHVPVDEPLKFVFLPHVVEMEFTIGGLPDAPNPRSTTDLFDVRIPRLTLGEGVEKAESDLIGILSVASETEWDLAELWEDLPSDFPSDRTFIDRTPRQLLEWYLKNTPESYARYTPGQMKLDVNQEIISRWDRLMDYIIEKLSFLL